MGGLRDRPMLAPSDHPEKEIREALSEILAMKDGNHFTLHKGGHWGLLACATGCCSISVSGSPRRPSGEARQLIREARKCPRDEGDVQNKMRR